MGRTTAHGFTLRYVGHVPVWVSASVERLIRAGAIAAAVRDHGQIASSSRMPVVSSWYELPLVGRHVRGSRLLVGIRTEDRTTHAEGETFIGLPNELPRRRGGRAPGRRR